MEELIGSICNFGKGLKCSPRKAGGRCHPHPGKNRAKYKSKSLGKEKQVLSRQFPVSTELKIHPKVVKITQIFSRATGERECRCRYLRLPVQRRGPLQGGGLGSGCDQAHSGRNSSPAAQRQVAVDRYVHVHVKLFLGCPSLLCGRVLGPKQPKSGQRASAGSTSNAHVHTHALEVMHLSGMRNHSRRRSLPGHFLKRKGGREGGGEKKGNQTEPILPQHRH